MDEIQNKIAELNALLGPMQPFSLGLFNPAELELLEINARFMKNETFAQLVANVKKDKGLASVPLVYAGPDAKKPRVLSGNHRVKVALAANLPQVLCLVINE